MCIRDSAIFSVVKLFILEAVKDQNVIAFISGIIAIVLCVLVLTYHMVTELCLKLWIKIKHKKGETDDGNDDLVSVDFDSRDLHEPTLSAVDEYLGDEEELSTLPDCGNSRDKQNERSNVQLYANKCSDDEDNASIISAGSMTPLLD